MSVSGRLECAARHLDGRHYLALLVRTSDRRLLAEGTVGINPIICAEITLDFADPPALNRWLDELDIHRRALP